MSHSSQGGSTPNPPAGRRPPTHRIDRAARPPLRALPVIILCMHWLASFAILGNCIPHVNRTAFPCELKGACGSARDGWSQYIGVGDWWASHITVERLVSAMLDDPFAHVGSVAFDIMARLFTGEEHWRPTEFSQTAAALKTAATGASQTGTELGLAFVKRSPHWKKVPHQARRRIEANQGLKREEAACAAALLAEVVVSETDGQEQKRWMDAVLHAAGESTPPGESPFTLHSTVYPQLARGWPMYSGYLTAVFTDARSPGSSGVDRFMCERRKSEDEHSDRNVDAGEFKTAAFKSPHEVEGVMISPPPAHPGMGRQLTNGPNAETFRAAFPTLNSSYADVSNFEKRWSKKDIFQFPMPFEPAPLTSALFRIRHNTLPSHIGSMVAVLAPLDGVYSVEPAQSGPGFVAANSPMRRSDRCEVCVPSGKRCFSAPAAPSTKLMPVAGMLFRCSRHLSSTFAMLEADAHAQEYAGVIQRIRASLPDQARLCCARKLLRDMHAHTDNQSSVTTAASRESAWPSGLVERLRRLSLPATHSVVNLHAPNKSGTPEADALCSLSLHAVLRLDDILGTKDLNCISSCSWTNHSRRDVSKTASHAISHDKSISHSSVQNGLSRARQPVAQPDIPPKISCHGSRLSVCRCDALLDDPASILSRMWSKTGWVVLHNGTEGGGPCWDAADGRAYFDSLRDSFDASGVCRETNWYGRKMPRFTDNAPALLGFDDAIKHHCLTINRARARNARGGTTARELSEASARGNRGTVIDGPHGRRLGRAEQECPVANRNILSMNDTLYNSCQNVQWQVCAARGQLHGQKAPQIIFAVAPRDVDLNGVTADELPPLLEYGSHVSAYDQASIFFLEVCTYSVLCDNREELFQLAAGDPFTCHVSSRGISRLQAMLLKANPLL